MTTLPAPVTECDGDGFGGRLVLQDLPLVIESLQPDDVPGVETMSHDIFTQQPIKSEFSRLSFVKEYRC